MEAFIGTIILFGGNFAPTGWLMCDGRQLQVSQHSALYAIIGMTYGGNGNTLFALPDLRGRVPVGMGIGQGLSPVKQGKMWGEEKETLHYAHLPNHYHAPGAVKVNVKNPGFVDVPVNTEPGDGKSTAPTGILSADGGGKPFTNLPADGKYSGKSLLVQGMELEVSTGVTGSSGDGLPHWNIQPSLGMN